MQITMQRTRPAWLEKTKLRMTLDCSRIAKGMSGLFFQGQQADIALLLQETRIRKIRKIFEENWSIISLNRAINRREPCAANLCNSVRYTITITFTQSKDVHTFQSSFHQIINAYPSWWDYPEMSLHEASDITHVSW